MNRLFPFSFMDRTYCKEHSDTCIFSYRLVVIVTVFSNRKYIPQKTTTKTIFLSINTKAIHCILALNINVLIVTCTVRKRKRK